MGGKIKKILLRTLVCLLAIALVITAAAYMLLRLYIIPKYNSLLGEDAAKSEKLTQQDMVNFAKYLTDKQVISNIVNFDKESAKDMLTVAEEIEQTSTAAPKKSTKSAWNKRVTQRVEALPTPAPSPTPTPAPTPSPAPEKSQVKGDTAYERIMNTATKEEISAGMAILSKVDMGKVNALRSQGKTTELKKYIASVLSGSEIRKALSLYNKYKHLL